MLQKPSELRRRPLKESLKEENELKLVSSKESQRCNYVEPEVFNDDETESPAEFLSHEDYSDEWLSLLESFSRNKNDTFDLIIVIDALKAMDPQFPPFNEPPFRAPNKDDADEKKPDISSINYFSALQDLDSVSEDERESQVSDNTHSRRSTLVGYLLIQANCLLADITVKDIPQLLVNKEYSAVALQWQKACDCLFEAQIVADPFLAVKLQAEETPDDNLLDQYDEDQLNEALDCLGIQAEDALVQLLSSLAKMRYARTRLEARLEFLAERKRQIIDTKGIEWWRNHPKKTSGVTDYTIEEKAQISRELTALDDALHHIDKHNLEEGLESIVEKYAVEEEEDEA